LTFALTLLPQMLPLGHFPTVVKSAKSWSGRRDSNPRPRPWQGCAPSVEVEQTLNILLPFCYPIRWQPMIQADTGRTRSSKYQYKTRSCRTGRYRAKWAQPHFECGAFDQSPILEAPARTRSSGGRRSPVGEAAFVLMAYYAKTDIPYQAGMRTLLGIGGRQDRGVRSWRGPKLTGIRQGKSRRRIRILPHNQWFAGVVQW
jgi:hypothetical protein